jgi:hypothetical protein
MIVLLNRSVSSSGPSGGRSGTGNRNRAVDCPAQERVTGTVLCIRCVLCHLTQNTQPFGNHLQWPNRTMTGETVTLRDGN